MIDGLCGFFSLSCDICGEELGEQFIYYHEAVEAKKEHEWKSKKIEGEWKDMCPECQ